MAVERKYLDYTGLQQFWAAIKEYYSTHSTSTAENLTSGVKIVFKDSRDNTEVLGTLTWDGSTREQVVELDMPAIDAEGPLAYSKVTGKLTIDLSNYYTSTETDTKIAEAAARALTFKGVVTELPPVSDFDLHAGDVFIVNGATPEETKEYIFVAAKGTVGEEGYVAAHFEELGFTVDLSGYFTKDEADNRFVKVKDYNPVKAALEAKDLELEGSISNNASAIDALEGRMDTAESDIDSLEGRMNATEGAIDTLEEGLVTEANARQEGDEAEALARDGAISDAFNTQLHVISYNNITGMFEETVIEGTTDAERATQLKQAVESVYTGGTVVLEDNAELAEPITLDNGQSVVVELNEGAALTGNGTRTAIVLDDAEAELLVVGDGEVGTTVGIQVNKGTVTINGGEFSGSSRGLQLGELVKSNEQLDAIPAQVTINGGEFGGADPETGYATSQAGIVFFGGDIVINSGTFVNTWYGLTGNGTKNLPDTNVTINGGYFEATGTADDNHGAAIYWPNSGTLTINGGTFKGGVAVYAKSGTVIINGGEFESDYVANAADVAANRATTVGGMRDYQYYSSGFYCTGDAIIIDYCCQYPSGDPKVKINKNIVMHTLAQGAHGVGIYYGRGTTQESAKGSVEVASGLNVDTHVYDLN